MSHYKMKCIHCRRAVANEQVVYKICLDELDNCTHSEKAENQTEAQVKDSEMSDMALFSSEFDDSELLMGGMGTGMGMANLDQLSERSDIMSMGSARPSSVSYMNRAELAKVCKVDDILADDIPTPTDSSMCADGDLTLGLRVSGINIDGSVYNGELMTRRCPYCTEKLLPQAGRMPIYVIGLFGHSTAGKTVFLTMQCFLTVINKKVKPEVPQGRIFAYQIQFDKTTSEDDDPVSKAANSFSQTGLFPPTTQELLPKPHCLRISYRRWKDGLHNEIENSDTTSCIMCFQDIRGEALTVGDPDDTEKLTQLFRLADGLIFVTDPTALDNAIARQGRADNNAVQGVIRILQDSLVRDTRTAVDIPTVCMLAKEDLIVEHSGQLGFRGDERAIASLVDFSYKSRTDWSEKLQEMSQSTKEVLKKLDNDGAGAWHDTLNLVFTDAVHIPISSIGKDVRVVTLKGKSQDKLLSKDAATKYRALSEDEQKDKAEEYSQMPSPIDLVKPRFIELPMLYFLSKFHIIPPFYDSDYYKAPEPSGFLGRLFRRENTEIVEQFDAWLEKYGQ